MAWYDKFERIYYCDIISFDRPLTDDEKEYVEFYTEMKYEDWAKLPKWVKDNFDEIESSGIPISEWKNIKFKIYDDTKKFKKEVTSEELENILKECGDDIYIIFHDYMCFFDRKNNSMLYYKPVINCNK